MTHDTSFTHKDDVPVAQKVTPPFPPRAAVMSCKLFCKECAGTMRTPVAYNESDGTVRLICGHLRNVAEGPVEVRR